MNTVTLWAVAVVFYLENILHYYGLYSSTSCCITTQYDHTCISRWHCDNVGGLSEHVTFQFLRAFRFIVGIVHGLADFDVLYVI